MVKSSWIFTTTLLASSVFGVAVAALPPQYERLECLSSTGTQYIDTGIMADDDYGYRLEFMCTQRQSAQFFCGSRNDSGDTRCCIGSNYLTDDYIPVAFFGWNTLVLPSSARLNCSTQCVAEVNYRGSRLARFGATTAALSTLTTQTYPFFLFAGNIHGSSPSTIGSYCRIYSFEMTRGQKTILNLLPARRISDGVLGMYDTVGGSFYVNAGSGTFGAGPVVDESVDVGTTIDVRAFSHRARVSFEAYEGVSTLADFPVLVRLSESGVANFRYSDLVNQRDLAFVDKDGHILASEVDTWNTNGESLIWVRVPSLTSSTRIYMYYGTRESQAASYVLATNVWSKYVGVYHLGTGLSEASGSGRNLVKPSWASVCQDGILGDCVTNALPTNLENLRLPTPRTALADPTCFTLTAWFKPDSRTSNGARLAASKQKYDIADGFEFMLAISGSTRALRIRTQAADDNNQVTSSYSAGYIPNYAWTHVGARFDGGSLSAFDNGANIASGTVNSVTGNDCGYWGIFGPPTSTVAIIYDGNAAKALSTFQGWTLTGLADEVRIYNGAASDLWVKTEHDTVTNPTFSHVTVDTNWTGKTGLFIIVR